MLNMSYWGYPLLHYTTVKAHLLSPGPGTSPGTDLPVFWTGIISKNPPAWTGKNFYEDLSNLTFGGGGGGGGNKLITKYIPNKPSSRILLKCKLPFLTQ